MIRSLYHTIQERYQERKGFRWAVDIAAVLSGAALIAVLHTIPSIGIFLRMNQFLRIFG